ncbi:cobyrinate a,c-diamide synthase [Desulfosediminicola sp.]|uniref:cobyrinate a,c-diamide synthase n=1 Tax=Desulfosediminicola sp. TaxID=2886825 RepID=UPI003AF23995
MVNSGRSEFLIGATKSGSGKTLITLGILAALAKRGIDVQPFKCGPDFIDPTLHQLVVPRPSINLDLQMMGEEGCRNSHHFYAADAEAVVVEGVMGLFDGGLASSAALAKSLDIPVLLIVDVRSAAESVAAVVKGFETYSPDTRLLGVICNRVGSSRHRQLIEDAISASCQTPILGFFPRDVDFEMPSRHLGLYMGHEIDQDQRRMEKLIQTVEESIDLDKLLELSLKKNPITPDLRADDSQVQQNTKPRLAVARDEAFCFYYPENIRIFEECGFEIVNFSPLHDNALPDDIAGIYLGGGYPELYAQQLSANISMRNIIRKWADDGKFIYGECGGFMYMTDDIVDHDGRLHEMAGIFPVSVAMKKRLSRLGYRSPELVTDCLLGDGGEQFFGHEFHYSDIVNRADELEFLYTLADGRKEGCKRAQAYGSYIHLHFARNVKSIKKLLEELEVNRAKRG